MRIHNNLVDRKTIAQTLKFVKNGKSSGITNTQIQIIRRLLEDSNEPKYQFEIIGLYHHMATNEDKKAFLALDCLLFPSRGPSQSTKIKNITLKLAYLRLHCLLKYQQPYSHWIQITREQLHHSKLSSTDIRSMLALAFFSFIKLDDKLLELYGDFLTYFGDEIQNIDTISLMVLRKFFSKQKIRTEHSDKVKHKIQQILTKNTKYLTLRQYQLLMTCNVLHQNWLFMYIFKTNLVVLKQYGFFIDIINRPYMWRGWALERFGRQGVLQRLPKFGKAHPNSILQHIQLKIAIGRPFCDQFFEFEIIQDPISGLKRYRLKNYEQTMYFYIQNAYIILANGGIIIEDQSITKIEQVLQDVVLSKFPGRPQVFLYLALHSSINYYKYINNRKTKIQKQKQMLANAYQIINNKNNIDHRLGSNNHTNQRNNNARAQKKIVLTRILRPLAILQLESYKLPEFSEIYKLLQICPEDLLRAMKFNSMSGEITEIGNVISNYITGKKSKEPLILFGQFKKHSMPNRSQLQFYSTTNVEFDRTITVDFLLKIKNKNTGKQTKILLDLGTRLDWPPQQYNELQGLSINEQEQNNVTVRKYWKKKYISEFYHQIFETHSEQTIQQYIQSRKYEIHL